MANTYQVPTMCLTSITPFHSYKKTHEGVVTASLSDTRGRGSREKLSYLPRWHRKSWHYSAHLGDVTLNYSRKGQDRGSKVSTQSIPKACDDLAGTEPSLPGSFLVWWKPEVDSRTAVALAGSHFHCVPVRIQGPVVGRCHGLPGYTQGSRNKKNTSALGRFF